MASVSISGLRRNIKNVAHNYTDAQVRRGLDVMVENGVRLLKEMCKSDWSRSPTSAILC